MAIALGSSTLKKFARVLTDSENHTVKVVKSMLQRTFMMVFNFREDYATWLPHHLEHLNEGSFEILKGLNRKDHEHVRYSTIVSVGNEQERTAFNKIMNPLIHNVPRARRNILESCLLVS